MTNALKQADELFEAIQHNNFRLTNKLLKKGANPNRLLLNGVTPFHLAVAASSTSSYQYVELILEFRGDPNVRDTEGLTPLHIAAQWGKADCLQLLLQCGADPNIKDKEGRDAYWFARESTNCSVILDEFIDSTNSAFDFKMQQLNPEKLRDKLCLNCGKVEKNILNFNNNITSRSKKDKSARLEEGQAVAPSGHIENRREDSGTHNDFVVRSDPAQTLLVPHEETTSVLQKPPDKPASGDRIYLDPNDGSFSTGLDATSPDNCFLFVRPHKRPSSLTVFDKTVPVCSQRSPLVSQKVMDSSISPKLEATFFCESPEILTQNRIQLLGVAEEVEDLMPEGKVGLRQASPMEKSTETFITPQQQLKMLRGTKDNVFLTRECSNEQTASPCLKQCKTDPSSSNFHPAPTNGLPKNFISEPSVDRTVLYSSSFTLADSTVPLECSSEQTEETFKTPDNLISWHREKEQANKKFKNDGFLQSDTKIDKIKDKLQSTCYDDFTDVLPESLDISHISAGDEVFIYSDSDGSTLIEQRCIPPKSAGPRSMDEILSPPIKLSVSQNTSLNATSDTTLIYDWKSLLDNDDHVVSGCRYVPSEDETIVIPQQIQQLSDDQIRKKLLGFGQNPGPISCARGLYKKRLYLLEKGFHIGQQQQHKGATFSHELRGLLLGKPLPDSVIDDDHTVRREFDNPLSNSKFRGGTAKDSFNYLLLDPRVTCKLPNRANNLSETDCLKVFAGAVFYVGKGKKSRPYAHFKEALAKKSSTPSRKIQHIHDIWSDNCGVISLHVFQNVMACEAFTREAAMIEALGLEHLTNGMRGKCYGNAANWDGSRVRRYGSYLVLKSMQILLLEGERQIRSNQISGGGKKTSKK